MVTINKTTSLTIFIKLDGANYHVCPQILMMILLAERRMGISQEERFYP